MPPATSGLSQQLASPFAPQLLRPGPSSAQLCAAEACPVVPASRSGLESVGAGSDPTVEAESSADAIGLDVSPASRLTAGDSVLPPLPGGTGSRDPLPPLAVTVPAEPVLAPTGVLADGAVAGGVVTVAEPVGVELEAEPDVEALGTRLSALVGGAVTTGELLCALLEVPSELPELGSVEHAGTPNASTRNSGAARSGVKGIDLANIGASDAVEASGSSSTGVRRLALERMVRMTVIVTSAAT